MALCKRPCGTDYTTRSIDRALGDSNSRPRIDNSTVSDVDSNMTLVVDHISPLHSRGANRHKRVVAIPIHGVIGLLGQPTVVIRVVPTHIHASRIQTLQHQARAINCIPRPRRPRLDITSSDIFTSTLDKCVDAILARSVIRNTGRRDVRKVSSAIRRKLHAIAINLWIRAGGLISHISIGLKIRIGSGARCSGALGDNLYLQCLNGNPELRSARRRSIFGPAKPSVI